MIVCSVDRSSVVAGELEARQAVDAAFQDAAELVGLRASRGLGPRVVEIDPLVGLEVRVERDRLEPVLLARVDLELGREADAAVGGVVEAQAATPVGGEHAPVGQDGEVHRLADLLGQEGLLIVAPDRRATLDVGAPDRGLDRRRPGAAGPPPSHTAALACPMPVYQDRPLSTSLHQAIGWSRPIAPAPASYEVSSRPASTCTFPRGLDGSVYQRVRDAPLAGQRLGRGVRGVVDLDGRRLLGGPGADAAADQRAVEAPERLGLGGGADRREASAAAHVGLQHALLEVREHVAGVVQEDDGVVCGQVRIEGARVLGAVHRDATRARHLADRRRRGSRSRRTARRPSP